MFSTTLSILALLVTALTAHSNHNSTAMPYRKVAEYSGSAFFDGFTTFTGPDPTGGYVEYVSLPTAAEHNLTAFIFHEEVNASNAFVGVDYREFPSTVNATSGRKSVRLMSKTTFDVGLLTVIDVVHVPTGPGVWPAVWLLANSTGDVWPNGGELDIMEWVNDGEANVMTLHTAPGCVVERSAVAYLGTMGSTDCNAEDGSEGCSVIAPVTITELDGRNLSTAGKGFNAQGGGVFVHEWTEDGVTEWLFPRDSLPADLASGTPDPHSWTTKPLAHWSGSGCQFDQAFAQQQLIINICLCGDWAGEVWTSSGMANRTGIATCDSWVAGHPEAFEEAFFEFASVRMFSSNPTAPSVAGETGKRDERWAVDSSKRHRHYRHQGWHHRGNIVHR